MTNTIPLPSINDKQKQVLVIGGVIIAAYVIYKIFSGGIGKAIGGVGSAIGEVGDTAKTVAKGAKEGIKSVVGATDAQEKAAATIAAAQTTLANENPWSPEFVKMFAKENPNIAFSLIKSADASKINKQILDKISFTADLNPLTYASRRDEVVSILTQNIPSKVVLSFLAKNMQDVYNKNLFEVLNDAFTSGAIIQNITHEPEKFERLIEWAKNLPNFYGGVKGGIKSARK